MSPAAHLTDWENLDDNSLLDKSMYMWYSGYMGMHGYPMLCIVIKGGERVDADIVRVWVGDLYPLKVWLVSAYHKSALCMKNAEDAMTYLVNDWYGRPWGQDGDMELLECGSV